MKGTLSVTYHFYVKDHLGNNRMVLSESAEVKQVTHYYPYGLPFASSTYRNRQPFKYNGKELDTEDNLNWMDYGARMYDAALGRWNGVDRYSEKYSSMTPYCYCGGNPIANIDVNGDSIDVSGLSEESQALFVKTIGQFRDDSSLFNKMYSSLENSSQKVLHINEKKIDTKGYYNPDNNTLYYDEISNGFSPITDEYVTCEELFHAYQNLIGDDVNLEFEAKVATHLMRKEIWTNSDNPYKSANYSLRRSMFPSGAGFDYVSRLNSLCDVFDDIRSYNNNSNVFAKIAKLLNFGNSNYYKTIKTNSIPKSLDNLRK